MRRTLSLAAVTVATLFALTSVAEAQWGARPTYGQQQQPTYGRGAQAGGGGWPSSPNAPQGALNPHFGMGPNWDMVVPGSIFFAMGYAEAIVMASIWLTSPGEYIDAGSVDYYGTCHDQFGALSLIPVVGQLIAASVFETCQVPRYSYSDGAYRLTGYRGSYNKGGAWASAIPGTVFQLLGFGLILGGELAEVRAVQFDRISLNTGGGQLSFAFSAPGAEAGLSVRFVH